MNGTVKIRVKNPANPEIQRHTVQMSAANLLSNLNNNEISIYTPTMTRGATKPTTAARAIDLIHAPRKVPHLRVASP
jgi:hypothetical protein